MIAIFSRETRNLTLKYQAHAEIYTVKYISKGNEYLQEFLLEPK